MIRAVYHGKAPDSYRYDADEGNVWVSVKPFGDLVASVFVVEEGAALSAGPEDGNLSVSTKAKMAAARGRFGTRTMLAMMRDVRRRYPGIREWIFRRVTGANPDTTRMVRV